jgi:hypothetical protein
MGFFVSGPYPLSQTLPPNPHKGLWEGSLRGGRGTITKNVPRPSPQI